MKIMTSLVAFVVCFASFAQAGEGFYFAPMGNDGVRLGFQTTFGATPKQRVEERLELAAVADTGLYPSFEVCDRKVKDGTAVIYEPQDKSRFWKFLPVTKIAGKKKGEVEYKPAPVGVTSIVATTDASGKVVEAAGEAVVIPSEGWRCAQMDTAELVKWVAQPPGTLSRYAVRGGVRDQRPYALHACGNKVHNSIPVELSHEQFTGTTKVVRDGGNIYIYNNVAAEGDTRKGWFRSTVDACANHPWVCTGIGILAVGVLACGVDDDHCGLSDDDNNAGGPSVSLGPDVSLDTSSNAPTIQAPDTVYNPGPGVSL